MRAIWGGLFVVAACASSSAPVKSTAPAAEPTAQNDSVMFPGSWPALRNLDAATEPARIEQLAGIARQQLDEEWELSTKGDDRKQAYKRLRTRVRVVHNNARMATGHSLDALADFLEHPYKCSMVPDRVKDTCEQLMASLATAFPNVVLGQGKIAQVDHSVVVEGNSEDELSAFVKKASEFQGSVVQRMRLTSQNANVLKIGTALQLRVASKQKFGGGEVMWVSFEPRKLKHVGKTWDLADATVLFVETKN